MPTRTPIKPEIIIQKLISKFLKINQQKAELITTRNVEIDLIIGVIIAIKVRGIINCKSKNCGKSPPNKTPVKVEICQDKNNVIPVPKR